MKFSFLKIRNPNKFLLSLIWSVLAGLFFLVQRAQAGKFERSKRAIPGQYIVLMKNSSSQKIGVQSFNKKTLTLADKHRATLKRRWGRQGGFVAKMGEDDAIRLAQDPDVALVEEDSYIYLTEIQSGVSWGLDKIDQRSALLDGNYETGNKGIGVNAYIFDTGIRSTHNEFGGRVRPGFTAFNDINGTEDCDGHGTHVAGIVGGKVLGVAKYVNLIPVRIMDCEGDGELSSFISGFEWVINEYKSNGIPAVANLSIGGFSSVAMNTSVQNAIKAGVTVVVAAGNDNDDACFYSPAEVSEAITVGAFTSKNTRASFSNFGSCVDIFAPGSSIMSSYNGGDSDIRTFSGTSMATPFVTGAAALYLSDHPKATPLEVSQALKNNGTSNLLSNLNEETSNLMLFTGFMLPNFNETPQEIPVVSPVCLNSRELLVNSDFEKGATNSWTRLNAAIESIKSPAAHSGKWKASLSGTGKQIISSLYQSIKIPEKICLASFSFWMRVVTSENKSSPANDLLYVNVTDEQGMILKTLSIYSNQQASAIYIKKTFDLSEFKGKNIRLVFKGIENKGKATRFLIDDTSLVIVQ